jgi:hypothetical protein
VVPQIQIIERGSEADTGTRNKNSAAGLSVGDLNHSGVSGTGEKSQHLVEGHES